MHLKTKQGIF